MAKRTGSLISFLPSPDYSNLTQKRRWLAENEGLGRNQPFAAEIMKPLLDLGMVHAVFTKRQDFESEGTQRHGRHTFTLMLDGRLSMQLDGTAYSLAAGDLAYFPPGTQIHQHCKGRSWYLYINFEPATIWRPLAKRGVQVRAYESADMMYLLMRRIGDAYKDLSLTAIQFARRDAAMLADLLKREIVLAGQRPHKRLDDLRALVSRIKDSPEADWDLPSMAADIFMSTGALIRLFRTEYGTTPMSLVIRERMLRARELIAGTNNTIEAVAMQMGYESLSSFTRLFKKHIGTSPGQCRDWDLHDDVIE